MPPRGVKKGSKRDRQYKEVKKGEEKAGRSKKRAEEIAARTVNKEKARAGESKTASRSTKEQLYNDAKRLNVEGRSSMSKRELEKAVAAKS